MSTPALPNVAAYFAGVQVGTLRQWVRRGKISPPVAGCYDLAEIQAFADEWRQQIADLEQQIRTEQLPASRLLPAADIAALVEVSVETVYVWRNRGILHRRPAGYDWREAALWLLKRQAWKISEPAATRQAL